APAGHVELAGRWLQAGVQHPVAEPAAVQAGPVGQRVTVSERVDPLPGCVLTLAAGVLGAVGVEEGAVRLGPLAGDEGAVAVPVELLDEEQAGGPWPGLA